MGVPSTKDEPAVVPTKRICPYATCKLPAHTYNYIAQFLYLLIAYFFLIRDAKEFSATNIVLYIIPIAIDLAFSSKRSGLPRIIQIILYAIVVFISIVSCCSLFGFFDATADAFVVSKDAVLFSGFMIKKTFFAVLLVFPIFTPFILSIGTVTRKDVLSDRTLDQLDEDENKVNPNG